MSQADRQLLDTESLSSGPTASADVESVQQISSVQIDAGSAAIHQDGAFVFTPHRVHYGGILRRCLAFLWRWPPKALQVPGPNVVGAETVGVAGFRIWYCTLKGAGSGKPVRQLHRSAAYSCRSASDARAFVRTVRGGNAKRRRVALILNPVSGRGKAQHYFKQHVQPFFEAAGVHCDLHVTQHAGHASEIVAGLDVSQLDALVFMGGDGTVHESLQGLLRRPDWQSAARVPLVLLPAGSGNALSANTGMWDLTTALHAVVKGEAQPLDILSVLQPGQPRRFAFLSVTFGLIANLDIGTEHLRWMGGLRFTVGALQQILGRRSHKLRLAYLPAQTASPSGHLEQQLAQQQQQQQQQQASKHASSAASSTAQPTAASGESAAAGATGPATPLLECLPGGDTAMSQEQLPQGWHFRDDMAVQLFAVCSLPYLDMSYNLAPRAGLSTGAVDILSTSRASRWQGLQFMLKSEKGQHLDMPFLDYRQVSALVIEPLSRDTWMVVDGEAVPFTRLYAQVHPGLCRVLVA